MTVPARIEALLRSDGPRLIAALARRYRDVERAEEAVQEAALRALETWPVRGVPDRPVAWLFTVARHRLVDALRREEPVAEDVEGTPDDRAAGSGSDDLLALLFACCHPAIAPRSQVGLALRTLCGLTTAEVARAFLETPDATARRLSRASQKIRAAGIPFAIPGPRARRERVAAVLGAVYLLFNEGYAATRGAGHRVEVCEQALVLGRSVAALLPEEPEVIGLNALMVLHHARRDGRFDAAGDVVLLDRQDRSRWRSDEVAHGLMLLEGALELGRPGPYQIQAAIAALHAQAPTAADTDWEQITALYAALLTHTPSPVVELNAAVALAMATGPARGLRWLDELQARGVLDGYAMLPAARADLLLRLGRRDEARVALDAALALVDNAAERRLLLRRRRNLDAPRRRRRVPTGEVPRPLSERDWRRVRALFPSRIRGRPARPDRMMVEAALWVLATGLPWRRLPAHFGPWQTAYHRFRQWEGDGRWAEVCRRLVHRAGARRLPELEATTKKAPVETGA